MGTLTQTSLRNTAVDFSYPYFFTRLGFYTKKPPPIPKLNALFWPYKKEVWLSLAGTLSAFTLVNLILSKVYKKRVSPNFNLGSAILQTCKMLAMQGMKKWPSTWKSQVLMLLWICFALFVALGTIRQIRASEYIFREA